MNSFLELGLIAPLCQAVAHVGYTTPTPIQTRAIPPVLEGRDLLGCARTGTGKTAAFALPILQRLAAAPARGGGRPVRALVLVPTRELAAQVGESFGAYGRGLPLSHTVIYGGVGQGPQVNALRRGVDVVVATPGRLVDLIGQGHARLDRVEMLVLDEADHMLDLGFLPDVKRILATLPKTRQTLFFSATMPPPIAKLAATILVRPVEVIVTPVASTVEAIEQRVHFVARAEKSRLLAELLRRPEVESALVFTRTKRGADRVARRLTQDGITAHAIHGNKSQNNRERTLDAFRDGRARVLVATDIAARGIDVDGITHVVNYELPNVPEVYVHRIGRTGRAGASGTAIAFCDHEERPLLADIEKLLRREIPRSAESAHATRGPARDSARASAGAPVRSSERDSEQDSALESALVGADARPARTHVERPAGGRSHAGHRGPGRAQGGRTRGSHGGEPRYGSGRGFDSGRAAASRGTAGHRPLARAEGAHTASRDHDLPGFGAGVDSEFAASRHAAAQGAPRPAGSQGRGGHGGHAGHVGHAGRTGTGAHGGRSGQAGPGSPARHGGHASHGSPASHGGARTGAGRREGDASVRRGGQDDRRGRGPHAGKQRRGGRNHR